MNKKTQRTRVPATFLVLNPNPIIEVDYKGKVLFSNPATQAVFPDLIEKGPEHPIFQDGREITEAFRDEGKASLRREVQIGDNWFIEQIFLVPGARRIRIYFTDINELKKTQFELEKERNLLQSIMNGAKNFHLVYLDNEFNFVRVNEAYAKSCGFSPKEMVGINLFGLYPHLEHFDMFQKARNTGVSVEFKDTPFVFCDQPQRGVTYWDWTLQPVVDGAGKVDGLVFSLVEMTERKKIQSKLEENALLLEEYANQMEELANERAKQLSRAERMATIGQTAGMVGHDIRNPLQAMAGELYLAKEEIEALPDNESKKNLQENVLNIEQNLFYIDKIVADLQDYTKPLRPNREKINVERAIEEALLIVAIPSNLQVHISTKECPQFPADLSMLKRVLINLIQNAVQAMPNGGTLRVNATCKDKLVTISIQDTGEGIPEEIKDKVFTPLFTTKSKGQGFGLAVAKRLIEAQNGKITFDTQKGKGTTFMVQLPLS